MSLRTTKAKAANIPVDHLKHADRRTNIPTEELRDMVADQEKSPASKLYPRDPSLDPQLVWKGKDEQDASDLAVPVVPVYIQEKIQPAAIVEEVRRQAQGGTHGENADAQPSLFSDFNGIDFEKQIDFYHHSQNWSNRMILGDSLLTMTSLAEKEGLKGKVQMIYMDPPYGIKFGSNWQVSTRKRDVKDGAVGDLTRQPEQVKAFRDTWELGIHSYLSYLRDRLVVARELLTESGSVFVQIGDENVHLVRCVLDEVFGAGNFVAQIAFKKTAGASGTLLSSVFDYLVWFSKQKETLKYRPIFKEKMPGEKGAGQYEWIDLGDGTLRQLGQREELPPGAKLFAHNHITSQRPAQGTDLRSFEVDGITYTPGAGTFKSDLQGLDRLRAARRLFGIGKSLRYVRYLDDFPVFPLSNFWDDTGISGFGDQKTFVVQTLASVVERCMLMTTDPGDLVLDPTCGSGTTAYVAEQWGRRWITIDTSRVALALARTRIMSARYPYYLMADSAPGIQKEAEITGQPPPANAPAPAEDIKRGFVYKRVPHVTLKSIANNEEIDAIHERWQKQLEPLRSQIQQAFQTTWEEWEIPREVEKATDPQKKLLAEWWKLRRERQAEIDASIARRAEVEMLYDQPYEDSKRVRVAGPFTVESLSPHRVLSTEAERPRSEVEGEKSSGQYETMVLDNLRKAGVQNTFKNERLKFDRLEPFAGEWLQAAGEYTDASGEKRRVAVSIGPQYGYGTVGPEQVKEAAKEAVRGIGYDMLVVCGFAFDPHVSEEGRRYGKLAVLAVRMNADLLIGDELLKKTGAGNLFTVFGEPDVRIEKQNGKLRVKLEGLDVYDPTTGEIRPSGPGEIACWFIDTDYNEESFFVRHAYFTGADQPYEKLKRALRADIDEAAWSTLYSTMSQEFDKPKTGKIAVKVINHYGDEVLKVFGV